MKSNQIPDQIKELMTKYISEVATHGNLGKAAQRIGRSRSAVNRWRDKYPAFNDEISAAKDAFNNG